ncbi:unnamed protein product [Blepharisma stoltei]|uniref:Uncharacterized protein n=1 Tax=Blepharisma stoltei TaxID=1481888 RepID=A0AAU9J633_9CILI|nr:unnamed protein product [Blepharisma stoltei]
MRIIKSCYYYIMNYSYLHICFLLRSRKCKTSVCMYWPIKKLTMFAPAEPLLWFVLKWPKDGHRYTQQFGRAVFQEHKIELALWYQEYYK